MANRRHLSHDGLRLIKTDLASKPRHQTGRQGRDQALDCYGGSESFERKLSEMWNLRDRAQRYARDVAPYFHPQLQAIKHDHRTADGAPLRPILVIEGYPSEPPALTNPKTVTGKGNNRH